MLIAWLGADDVPRSFSHIEKECGRTARVVNAGVGPDHVCVGEAALQHVRVEEAWIWFGFIVEPHIRDGREVNAQTGQWVEEADDTGGFVA